MLPQENGHQAVFSLLNSFNFEFCLPVFVYLRHADYEEPVFFYGFRFVWIYFGGEKDCSGKTSPIKFTGKIIIFGNALVAFALAADGDRVPGDIDVQCLQA